MMIDNKKIKLGFAPTRRNVFSREDSIKYKKLIETKLKQWGVDYVNIDWLNKEGLLYDLRDSSKVAARFVKENVDALFVPHCNFGTEDAVAKLARELGKPVLLWGPRDENPLPDGTRLRDTQCGLFATSKILRRLNVPFTYIVNTRINDPVFESGFKTFTSAVNVSKTFLNARIGQLDTRPAGFWTVMVNEGELLERWGIQIVPTSLVDIEHAVRKLIDKKPKLLKDTITDFNNKVDFGDTSSEAIEKMAALKIALMDWVKTESLDAIAIQCWNALQLSLGISACFVNSELTSLGIPVACETDIHGALSSIMAQAAVNNTTVPFFADLTIRHPDNDNAELLWHCGPFPITLAEKSSKRKVGSHYILDSAAPGCAEWQIKGGDITVVRFDGDHSEYSLFIGRAVGTKGPFMRGTYLWIEVDNWPKWEQKFIYGPYIHHVAGIHGTVAGVLQEACKYIPGLKPDPV
jgi:L-fucose isomerase-like protein